MIDRLTVLGPGTILPLPDYGCSGYLLYWKSQAGGGGRGPAIPRGGRTPERPILIDCGPGTLDRLCEHDTSAEEIDLILLSHFHVDHVSDLAAVLLARWVRNLRKGEVNHRVTVVGPLGLSDHIAALEKLNQPWMSEYRFDLVELTTGGYSASAGSFYDGLEVHSALTGHTTNSLCFRITDEARRCFFYSGDTDYNESLVALAEEADLAVFECSMPDDRKLEGHLTPRLAGRLAQKARVGRLLLTHFYEEVLAIDIVEEVRSEYEGSVELARKLETYPVSRPPGA